MVAIVRDLEDRVPSSGRGISGMSGNGAKAMARAKGKAMALAAAVMAMLVMVMGKVGMMIPAV